MFSNTIKKRMQTISLPMFSVESVKLFHSADSTSAKAPVSLSMLSTTVNGPTVACMKKIIYIYFFAFVWNKNILLKSDFLVENWSCNQNTTNWSLLQSGNDIFFHDKIKKSWKIHNIPVVLWSDYNFLIEPVPNRTYTNYTYKLKLHIHCRVKTKVLQKNYYDQYTTWPWNH